MSASVASFVDDIDGVRGDVAASVAERFDTVAALGDADPAALTDIRGVGPVLADRILAAARAAVVADHTPEVEPEPTPAERARAGARQAVAANRPTLDVIEGDAASATEAADQDTVELPPTVERLASLVGHTLGWGIRVYRTVTRPVFRLLGRG